MGSIFEEDKDYQEAIMAALRKQSSAKIDKDYQQTYDEGMRLLASGGGYRGGTPEYSSHYQGQADALTSQLGQKSFSYDAARDPLYEQYRKAYTREGTRAMQDTVGQVSARTGGLASSYAATAGAQANNVYMAKLTDKIPELQKLAYEMYLDEKAGKRADINALLALEKAELERYQTLLNQYNKDRDFDYKAWAARQT